MVDGGHHWLYFRFKKKHVNLLKIILDVFRGCLGLFMQHPHAYHQHGVGIVANQMFSIAAASTCLSQPLLIRFTTVLHGLCLLFLYQMLRHPPCLSPP